MRKDKEFFIFEKCYKDKAKKVIRYAFDKEKDYNAYKKLGLGVVILKDGDVVAGASSYSTYDKGIEIEIDTKEGYRRKGLAYEVSGY